MTTALTILALIGWSLVIYVMALMLRNTPTRWRTECPPEGKDRGPNADAAYRAVRLSGHDYWFTAEEVLRANERALKYDR